MGKKIPVVSIIGRANVGKSTLFNALVGRRSAVVDDLPGVTRDRKYGVAVVNEISFKVIDTGGIVGGAEEAALQALVRMQAELAIQESDLVVGVFDGMHGLHPLDNEVVDILRRAQKPVLWAVNKCEKPLDAENAAEFYSLGIGEPMALSAAYGAGLHEFKELLAKRLSEIAGPASIDEAAGIKIAFLGKPNVGKSTLVNRLLGEDRVICSAIPGTTRDSIDVHLRYEETDFTLIDTAGLRKKSRVSEGSVERFSNLRTLDSIERADVVVLVIDADEGLPTDQDGNIAKLVHERGRSLVIAVNKWDAVEKDYRSAKDYGDRIFKILHVVKYAPLIFVSGLTGKRCAKILEKVKEVHAAAQARIPTGELNRILGRAIQRNPPPVRKGNPAKLFFATQVETQPPTIVFFLNSVQKMSDTYQRYLKRELRREYPFEGCDIKFQLRRRGVRADMHGSPR